MSLTIALVAGEASGDLLGAGLIAALKQQYPTLNAYGIGGEAMQKAGFHALYDLEELAVMGIIEPLRRLPRLLHIRRALYRHISKHKPDVFIGIDAPDFNLGLELQLHKLGIPTVHYVSPSVWAWRQYRIHKIARAVDLMLTLLPFEAEFYKKHQVPVHFVGHPLADKIPLKIDKQSAKAALGLHARAPYIALLPGSRRQELEHLGKAFLETAVLCKQAQPELRFITASINAKRDQEWRALHQAIAPELPLEFFIGRASDVMAAADAILVTSGTATLEAMLYKRPMVIAYHTSAFNYFLAKCLVKTPFIGLPNLLAQKALVPEFIQEAVIPEQMAKILLDYCADPEKTKTLEEAFTNIHQTLAIGANQQAAKAILKLINKYNCSTITTNPIKERPLL